LTSTAGIHPHDATRAVHSGLQDSIQRLEALMQQHPKTVRAMGECGLDFDRDFSSRSDQEAVFRAQISLAKTTGLPLFMHERSAQESFLEILAPHMGEVTGVVHCFTGDKTVSSFHLKTPQSSRFAGRALLRSPSVT
jgi:TatD DNase family protein